MSEVRIVNKNNLYLVPFSRDAMTMLKKIDCVMIQVEDVKAAMTYYTDIFGLQPVWWDESSAGLVFKEPLKVRIYELPRTLRRDETIATIPGKKVAVII